MSVVFIVNQSLVYSENPLKWLTITKWLLEVVLQCHGEESYFWNIMLKVICKVKNFVSWNRHMPSLLDSLFVKKTWHWFYFSFKETESFRLYSKCMCFILDIQGWYWLEDSIISKELVKWWPYKRQGTRELAIKRRRLIGNLFKTLVDVVVNAYLLSPMPNDHFDEEHLTHLLKLEFSLQTPSETSSKCSKEDLSWHFWRVRQKINRKKVG